MTSDVQRNVRKILARMPRFKAIASDAECSAALSGELDVDEEVYGRYDNLSESLPDIWVTSQALRVLGKQGQNVIAYSEIESVDTGQSKGKAPLHVLIKTTAGRTIVIPITGNDGKVFDAFEFCRFLMRTSGQSPQSRRGRK